MLAHTLNVNSAGVRAASTHRHFAPWRTILAASVGNAFEYYDLLIRGYFATAIGKLSFPTGSVWSSLMLFVGTFNVSFIMHPSGSTVPGSYADRVGRKAALTWLILLMALGTAMTAFTPIYMSINLRPSVIAIVARSLQGFSAGGEFGPAMTFMIEHANGKRMGYDTSW